MNKRLSGLVLVLMLCLAASLRAADGGTLGDYYDNTLIWQNQISRAVGRLWLNRDGRYYAFYNLGSQSRPPDVNGPFQVEGRIGTYTVREDAGQSLLCLWPAAPRTRLGAEIQHELFAENRCYRLPLHRVGDSWTQLDDTDGRAYKYWFVPGR